jgi:TPR repeat protein
MVITRGLTIGLLLAISCLPCVAQGKQAATSRKPAHKATAAQSSRELHALALMYLNGTMVKRNEKESARLMMQAAERGHVPSTYYMGVFYHGGIGVPRDHQKAADWLRRAAERGYAEAQYALALVLLSGDGVPADRQEAVELLGKAAGQGDEAAAEFLKRLVAYRGPSSHIETELKNLPPPELKMMDGQEQPPQKPSLMLDEGAFSLRFSLPEVERPGPYEPAKNDEGLLERFQGGKVEIIIPLGK